MGSIGLTKKQRGFVKDIIKTGNATKAALNNYDIESEDEENVAGAIGSENLRKPKIQEALKPFLERYQKELSRILSAMENKQLDKEQYRTLVESADKIQKQIQLLTGGASMIIQVGGVEINVRK
jgi:phage terminase small subunit